MTLDDLAGKYVTQEKILSSIPWLTTKSMAALRRQGLKYFRANGGFVYLLSDLEKSLEGQLCTETASGNMEEDGSAEFGEVHCFTSSGTTQAEDERFAEALGQTISSRPRPNSSGQSTRNPAPRRTRIAS